MKTIPNQLFPTTRKDGKNDSVARFILDCLNTPPQTGFDFATMRARIKVTDKLEKVADGGVIELEDAEYATALDAIKATRWVISNKSLLVFAELFGL